MIHYLRHFVIPAAYDVLPPAMASDKATAMLLAIALQESGLTHRRQVHGPARGFWQFEQGGGVLGVMTHTESRRHVLAALPMLAYSSSMTTQQAHVAIEHNDVLAAVFARLLLWTLPHRLPGPLEADVAWTQYLAGWRPGKPHPTTWSQHYAMAHNGVLNA